MTRTWVLDTCAVLDVRRCVVPTDPRQSHAKRRDAYAALAKLAAAGRLVFPNETLTELQDGHAAVDDKQRDAPLTFADGCKESAMRPASLDTVKELLAHKLVQRVMEIDAEKDVADIYVLALARDLQSEGMEVGVLTQERIDSNKKISVNTACGILGIVCLRMEAFLDQENIWPWSKAAR